MPCRSMQCEETTGERYRKRQQQRSIMAVMDPYNPPASKKRATGLLFKFS